MSKQKKPNTTAPQEAALSEDELRPPVSPEEMTKIEAQVADGNQLITRLKEEMALAIVGQTSLIDSLLIGLLSDGHVLVEGVPGLAKTTIIKHLTECIQAEFHRIQFTPDLLPADVVGTQIYSKRRASLPPARALFSRTSCWRMKSTAVRRRCKAPCWRRCRSIR